MKSDNLNSMKKSANERKDRPHAHYCKELLAINTGFFIFYHCICKSIISSIAASFCCQIVKKRNRNNDEVCLKIHFNLKETGNIMVFIQLDNIIQNPWKRKNWDKESTRHAGSWSECVIKSWVYKCNEMPYKTRERCSVRVH